MIICQLKNPNIRKDESIFYTLAIFYVSQSCQINKNAIEYN